MNCKVYLIRAYYKDEEGFTTEYMGQFRAPVECNKTDLVQALKDHYGLDEWPREWSISQDIPVFEVHSNGNIRRVDPETGMQDLPSPGGGHDK